MPEIQDYRLAPAIWTRTTPWRQGSVIPTNAAVELGLIRAEEAETSITVVISHDCDLSCDRLEAEPAVEVMAGCRIDATNGNFTAAKNPRILHIELYQTEAVVCVELNATRKATVPKQQLASYQPESALAIKDNNLSVLQAWLAARYKRAAFPDELVNRFKPIHDAFVKAAKKTTDEILGIFIDYEPHENGLAAQEPYSLFLTVVFSTDIADAEPHAQQVVNDLCEAFDKYFRKNDHWQLIELRGCVALSDTEFTLRDVLQTKQYRLEYISYRQDPPGEIAEVS